MKKKEIRRLAVWMGLMVFISSLMLGVGCSREQAPPPPQAAAPAGPGTADTTGSSPGGPARSPGSPGAQHFPIQTGMTIDQVKQIMGNPAEMKQKGTMTEYKYYTPQKVEIKFQNNQVMAVEMH